MEDVGAFLGRVFHMGGDQESRQSQERQKSAFHEARTIVKKIETELKKQGSHGVIIFEHDKIFCPPLRLDSQRVIAPGKSLNLRWDFNVGFISTFNKGGYQSKEVCVGILREEEVIIGYSVMVDIRRDMVWLEEDREYLGFLEVRRRAGRPEPTLEEKIKFALAHAVPVPDHRFAKI